MSDSLEFNRSALDLLGSSQTLYVTHNHPGNASFSMVDIMFLISNNNVNTFSLITNTGRIEALTKGNKYDKLKVLRAYIAFSNKMKPVTDAEKDIFVIKLLNMLDDKGWIKWKK